MASTCLLPQPVIVSPPRRGWDRRSQQANHNVRTRRIAKDALAAAHPAARAPCAGQTPERLSAATVVSACSARWFARTGQPDPLRYFDPPHPEGPRPDPGYAAGGHIAGDGGRLMAPRTCATQEIRPGPEAGAVGVVFLARVEEVSLAQAP